MKMKKTITFLKTLLLFILIAGGKEASGQCAVSFSYNTFPNGVTTFTSYAVPPSTVSTITYYWNFGNNTTYSATGWQGATAMNTYTANGQYTVTLFILTSAPNCSAQVTQVLNITNAGGCPLSANWGYSQGFNGQVNFTNYTSGTTAGTTYSWNFGDNSSPGTTASPSHNYAANGQYTVTMTATNNGTCSATHSAVINVNSICTINASMNVSYGNNGQVIFQSTSTGTTQNSWYTWKFGDNSQQSTITPSVNHAYINGTYTVMLIAYSNTVNLGCADSVSQVITVTNATCNLVAGATASMGANGQVHFINNSLGTNANTTYTWSFGNGQVSNASNPTVTYQSGGSYNVYLHASNGSGCTSSTLIPINVTSIPCIANAGFTLVPGLQPQHWIAIPAAPWNVYAYYWTWGDNTSTYTNTLTASHQYSTAGTYSICLTVTASCNAIATACSSYSVFRSSQSQNIIYINTAYPDEINIDAGTPTSINDLDMASDLNVYPNPTSGAFMLNVSGNGQENAEVSIYNLLGDKIYTGKSDFEDNMIRMPIDISNAAEGMYILKIKTDTSETTRRIVVDK